jgi:hypothetical protein
LIHNRGGEWELDNLEKLMVKERIFFIKRLVNEKTLHTYIDCVTVATTKNKLSTRIVVNTAPLKAYQWFFF